MVKNIIGLMAILLICVACGGGDEGLVERGGGTPTRNPLPEPSSRSPSTAWSNSQEYRASNGLRMMRAAEGYAARTTGQPGGRGKTVAVLDSPLDVRHPDLLARGVSTRAFDFEFDNPNFRDPTSAHGTHVAGTAAARRDGVGVHGVAYNAHLVGVSVMRSVSRQRLVVSPVVENATDAAAGIASAAGLSRTYQVYDQFGRPVYELNRITGLPELQTKRSNRGARADVMNMSFGTPDPQGQVLSAMRDAARANKIMVAALGNCGPNRHHRVCNAFQDFDGIGPTSAPARYMSDSGVRGFGIAVGALDESGRGRASFSNTCADMARYCLFAPGSNIQSTVPQNGYGRMSGTSMASPHVTGAAAAVWAAFPNKRANQILGRLLSTARPLDRYEISPVFGHGALDLQAALSPVGFLSLSTPGGGTAEIGNSFVQVPPGFTVPSDSMDLAGAVTYDEEMFPFLYDLNGLFHANEFDAADNFAQWFLSSMGKESTTIPMGRRAAASFVHTESERLLAGGPSSREDEHQNSLSGFSLNFNPAPGLTISLGNMTDPMGASNGAIATRSRQALFPDQLSVSPFSALVGPGFGANLGWRWDEDTVVDVVGVTGSGYFGSTTAQLTAVGLSRQLGAVQIGLRYGMLQENGSRMGVRAEGAMGGVAKAASHFVDLSVESRVTEDALLFGSMTQGIAASASPSGSLVSDWGTMQAESFLVGTEINRIWTGSDRLVFTASIPFRVRDAILTMNVPFEEIEDGVVRYRKRSLNLAPRGREKRLQLVYGTEIGNGVTVTTGGYARIEPDHDAKESAEFGAAGKIHVSF